jgi:hypothetical protein
MFPASPSHFEEDNHYDYKNLAGESEDSTKPIHSNDEKDGPSHDTANADGHTNHEEKDSYDEQHENLEMLSCFISEVLLLHQWMSHGLFLTVTMLGSRYQNESNIGSDG